MKRKFIAIFVGLMVVVGIGANYERLSIFFFGTKYERFRNAVSKHISVDLIGYKLEKTEISYLNNKGIIDISIKNVGLEPISGVKGWVYIYDMYGAKKQMHMFSYNEGLDVNEEVKLKFEDYHFFGGVDDPAIRAYDKILWSFAPEAIAFTKGKIMTSP